MCVVSTLQVDHRLILKIEDIVGYFVLFLIVAANIEGWNNFSLELADYTMLTTFSGTSSNCVL
jgi:hypothetical protein